MTVFFFSSDFWFTESVKYLCFHQKPKFTDSQWEPHFPNLPFKTQLLAVLLSFKLLIPVNYGCEGQHPLAFREWTSQAESCKLENIKVDFPSRENLWPLCTWESLTQLELRVNWAWCIRPWKSQSSSRSQHAAKGEMCSTVWGSGRELMVQKVSETCWLPKIPRRCPVPCSCFQPQDVSPFWACLAQNSLGARREKVTRDQSVSTLGSWQAFLPSASWYPWSSALSPTSPCPQWCRSAFLQNKSCPRLQMAVVISLTDINKIDGCKQTNDLL